MSSSSSVAINSLTLGVLEAAASTLGASSSPPISGAKASRRTEKANGLGAKSAQGLKETFDESRETSGADGCAVGELAVGICVLFRQRGQRIARPAKCEATVSSERQDSQKNVILIVANFKRVTLKRWLILKQRCNVKIGKREVRAGRNRREKKDDNAVYANKL